MPFSVKDQIELNADGVKRWFRKYSEFLSCYVIEGQDGLKEILAAYYRTTGHGEQELANLAANSLSEKQVIMLHQANPDARIPNYDAIYLAAVERLASQAFLAVMNNGALDGIVLVDEFPPLAEAQYKALINEAEPQQKVAAFGSTLADLKQFKTDYLKTACGDLRQKNGVIRIAGKDMRFSVFEDLLEKTIAAGLLPRD
jgi:hypothetical protein